MNYTELITKVYNDDNFIRLKSLYSKSTIFDILGITRREMIHSNIISWILNPKSSHQMGEEPLRKFIRLLNQINTDSNKEGNFPVEFETSVIADSYVIEDLNITREQSIGTKQRIDIYLTAKIRLKSDEKRNLQIIIENKVEADEHGKQTQKYYKWGESRKKNSNDYLIAVFLTPDLSKKCSDEHYIQLSYQQLTDMVLCPLKIIPKSTMADFLIDEYLRSLGRAPFQSDSDTTQTKRSIMAIQPEEKKLIMEFYENNQELMMSIISVLVDDEELQISDEQRDVLREINVNAISNRDMNNYRYKGKLYISHVDLVLNVFKDYVEEKKVSFEEFLTNWQIKKAQYLTREEFDDKKKKNELKWPFDMKNYDNYWVKFYSGEEIFIASNWPLSVKGKDAAFADFLNKASELEIVIEPCAKNNK